MLAPPCDGAVMALSDVLAGRARWSVTLGNALALLQAMPDACVDAVITDAPYSSGGQYRGDRIQSTGSKYVQHGTEIQRPDFAGDNRDQRSFGYWCSLWLSECLRVAKPGSPICLFTDWRQLPTTTDALQAGGWVWRGILPWDKTEGARPQMGRFCAQCEYVVWGSAGAMPEDRGVGCLPGFVRAMPRPAEKRHQTGKTPRVMLEVNAICSPGGIILDPFVGGCSTGAAAMRAGYRFVGFELTSDYYRVACEVMSAEASESTPEDLAAGQRSLFSEAV